MIGTAMAIGLGAAALGGALSSRSKNKAANKAADVTMATTRENNALARDMYAKNEGYLGPLAQSAGPANSLLGGAAGYGDQQGYRDAFRSFIDNSDYGFQFGEGANDVNSGYAGAGMIRSGAAMSDIEKLRQNLQSGYRGEFNSLLDSNRAFGLGAGSALAGVGQNYVGAVTANNNNAGEARANALLYKGANNPLAGALGMVGGALTGMAR